MRDRIKGILADFFQQADLVLLSLCCVSTLYGIVMVYSATRYLHTNRNVIVQSAALLLGIVVYILLSMVDFEILLKKWKWILLFNIAFILLLLTPFGVSDQTGNTAWLKFPYIPVSIGPAEVVKITFTLLLAKQLEWLMAEKRDLRSLRSAVFAGGHMAALCGLYFIVSGDMGNALVFAFVFLCMSYSAGFAKRWFALFLGGAGAAAAVLWRLDLIPSYMKDRFIVLFDHAYQPLDTGWHQTRSMLTLGAGGLFGQGYLHGTQTQAGAWALPARHTDFIFSVIGEELGLVGCLVVIVLLAAIIFRVLTVARHAQTPFSAYTCVGIAAMLIFQSLINIGMCLFVMPVIGLTLPFFSYGGSSIVTLFAAMGIVSSIKKRTPVTRKPGRPIH